MAGTEEVSLRCVESDDLPIFFSQQLEPAANRMAAFIRQDPSDRPSFDAHWDKILHDSSVVLRAILVGGRVAGFVGSFERNGVPELTYWLGKEFWGRGAATSALKSFLTLPVPRPIFARVAKDNVGSARVLAKCGFKPCGEDRCYSNARGTEIDELIFELAL